jgi:hypothetical protein
MDNISQAWLPEEINRQVLDSDGDTDGNEQA